MDTIWFPIGRDSFFEKAPFRAQVERMWEQTGIPVLERRIMGKVLDLLPTDFPRELMKRYWQEINPMAFFLTPETPFLNLEFGLQNSWRRLWLKEVASLPPQVRAKARNAIPENVFLQTLKGLRPAFQKIRYEYITELALLDLEFLCSHDRGEKIRRTFVLQPVLRKAFTAAKANNDLKFFGRVIRMFSRHKVPLSALPPKIEALVNAYFHKRPASVCSKLVAYAFGTVGRIGLCRSAT